MLLSHNIHFAPKGDINLTEKFSNIQIKRLPFLHFHPDVEELTNFCHQVKNKIGVRKFLFYHYKQKKPMEDLQSQLEEKLNTKIMLPHQLAKSSIYSITR